MHICGKTGVTHRSGYTLRLIHLHNIRTTNWEELIRQKKGGVKLCSKLGQGNCMVEKGYLVRYVKCTI